MRPARSFRIPELKIGTYDKLVQLNDDLEKVSSTVESTTARLHKQLLDSKCVPTAVPPEHRTPFSPSLPRPPPPFLATAPPGDRQMPAAAVPPVSRSRPTAMLLGRIRSTDSTPVRVQGEDRQGCG